MGYEAPKSRINLRQIQTQKRNIPLEQIIAIEGQNPLATGVEAFGNVMGQALAKKEALRKQGEQVAQLLSMARGDQMANPGALTPELTQKGLAERAAQAKTELDSQLKLSQMEAGYKQVDPATGAITEYPGQRGLLIERDAYGNPRAIRNPDYKPGEKPVPGGGAAARGSIQQSTYVDSADATPLLFDRDHQRYIRSNDGQEPKGSPVPSKGQAEAIQSTSRGKELLPKIDTLFDALDAKTSIGAKLAVTPGVSDLAYPEINQLKAEVKQVGFTFGGKNFTGNEEKIITDALIPKWNDNDASRAAKRAALKGYISGQIDLLGAANLLGPAGAHAKTVIQGGGSGLRPLPVPASQVTPITATNPKTGQKIISTDGGQTWQPAK